jgi:hypothetical protein
VHEYDEANIKGIRLSHDNQGIRWGLAWVPNNTKILMLVLIVTQHPQKHTHSEINGAIATLNMSLYIMYIGGYARVAMHKRDTNNSSM